MQSRDREWAIVHKSVITDLYEDSKYLTRWRIIQTPWFALYLHHIHRPDHERDLHDHPWNFISIILWGGYAEEIAKYNDSAYDIRGDPKTKIRTWKRGSVHYMRTEDAHRISSLLSPVWTLLLCGRRRREWGFWRAINSWVTAKTWIPHFTYIKLINEERAARDNPT